MELNEIVEIVSKEIKEYRKDRYIHTMGVYEAAIELGKIHKLDLNKVALAALFHDFAKGKMPTSEQRNYIEEHLSHHWLSFHPNIYHAIVAMDLIEQRFQIHDEDIKNAILYHVTGHPEMNIYAKVLFIADFCEKNRRYYKEYGKEYFEVAKQDIDAGLYLCLEKKYEVLTQVFNEQAHEWTLQLLEKMEGEKQK